MKRDMDLVREILLKLEAHPAQIFGAEMEIDGYSKEEINFHLMLMNEAGLINADDSSAGTEIYFLPLWITWAGYEFLDDAKNDTRWGRAKSIMQKTVGVSFEVLKEILKTLITQEITGLLKNP